MANMDELKESADAKARERIKEAWDLFDKEKRGVIIQECVARARNRPVEYGVADGALLMSAGRCPPS